MPLHSDYLLTASGSRRSNALALGVILALLVGAAGLAVGSLGIMSAVLLAIPIFIVLVINPLLGLLAMAVVVSFEVAFMLGGATLTRLIGPPVAIAWLTHKLLAKEPFKAIVSERFVLASLLFFAFALASLMWAEYPVQVNAEFLRLGMLFALSVLVLDLLREWKHLNMLVRALIVGAIIAATIMVAQYFGTGIRRAGELIAGDPNAAAYVLVSLMPFAFYMVRAKRQGVWRFVGLAYLVLGVTAVATSLSRMAFLMIPLIVLAEYWELLRARAGRVFLLGASVIALILALRFMPIEAVQERVQTIGPYIESTLSGDDDPSSGVSGRGYHIRIALAIFQDYPLMGVGYRNYGDHFLRYQRLVPGAERVYRSTRSAHGSHYQVMAELGIFGLLIWTVLFVVSYKNLRLAYKRTSVDRRSAEFQLVRAISLVFLLQVLYGFYTNIHVEKIFWLLLGLTVAARVISGRSHEADSDHVVRPGSAEAEGRQPVWAGVDERSF